MLYTRDTSCVVHSSIFGVTVAHTSCTLFHFWCCTLLYTYTFGLGVAHATHKSRFECCTHCTTLPHWEHITYIFGCCTRSTRFHFGRHTHISVLGVAHTSCRIFHFWCYTPLYTYTFGFGTHKSRFECCTRCTLFRFWNTYIHFWVLHTSIIPAQYILL